MLSEGTSINCIDTIVIADPRYSFIRIIQMIGRGLRLHSLKTICRIIIASKINDENELLSDDQFQCVYKVLEALLDHDPRVIEQFDSNKNTNKILLNFYSKDMNEISTQSFPMEYFFDKIKKVSMDKYLNSLTLEQKIDLIQYYYNTHHKLPNANSKELFYEYPICDIIDYVKNNFSCQTSEQRELLYNIPKWKWNKNHLDVWNFYYDKIVLHYNTYRKSPSKKINLGNWVDSQCNNYGRKLLTLDQINKLNRFSILEALMKPFKLSKIKNNRIVQATSVLASCYRLGHSGRLFETKDIKYGEQFNLINSESEIGGNTPDNTVSGHITHYVDIGIIDKI
jgi:hypothetical protein